MDRLQWIGAKLGWVVITAQLLRRYGKEQYGESRPWDELLAISLRQVSRYINRDGTWN